MKEEDHKGPRLLEERRECNKKGRPTPKAQGWPARCQACQEEMATVQGWDRGDREGGARGRGGVGGALYNALIKGCCSPSTQCSPHVPV